MKYFITIFVTAVVVFLGAYVYFKGLPTFPSYNPVPVSTQSGVVSTLQPTAIPTESSSPKASISATQKADENISIVSAVQAALVAEHGQDAASLNITISKIEGNYASGMASAQGGGGIWYAAQLNGKWILVWDGNGQIDCSSLAAYPAFPKDLIPSCWDTNTQAVVNR
ncbi:MAG: hypothetical protein ABSE04_03225 [Candidatus Microgenomates bacterium]|jgi:hypothetical protein